VQKIKFWKMSGAGNDFVLLSGGRFSSGALRKLSIRLCDRKRGVGADGLLHISKAGPLLLAVRYFNSDGSEAFCGNGSRCAAWQAWRSGLIRRKKFILRTAAGDLPAEIIASGAVRMRMPEVRGARMNFKGRYPAGIGQVHFLNTGVPHAVVPVLDLEKTDVARFGRALRFNKAFGSAGANINFVRLEGGTVLVRTYERGVEGETLACGTGITAAAVALALAGLVKSPVRLAARSGDKFRAWLKPGGGGASEIYLQGPAQTVFEGEIKC
jgi:diaminopimelate epimerase